MMDWTIPSPYDYFLRCYTGDYLCTSVCLFLRERFVQLDSGLLLIYRTSHLSPSRTWLLLTTWAFTVKGMSYGSSFSMIRPFLVNLRKHLNSVYNCENSYNQRVLSVSQGRFYFWLSGTCRFLSDFNLASSLSFCRRMSRNEAKKRMVFLSFHLVNLYPRSLFYRLL